MERGKRDVRFLEDAELWDRYIDWTLDMHVGFGSSEASYNKTKARRRTNNQYPDASLVLDGQHLTHASLSKYIERRFGHR